MAWLREGLQVVGVAASLIWRKGDLPRIYGTKLQLQAGALFVFVSETSEYTEIDVYDPFTRRAYALELEAERVALFAVSRDGDIIASYRGVPVLTWTDTPTS